TAATAPPPSPRGLRILLAGQAFWLPLDQVVEVLDTAEPVAGPGAVPWAGPRAPSILMRADEPIAVIRPDLLLRLPSASASPTPAGTMSSTAMSSTTMSSTAMPSTTIIVCRVDRRRVAFQVDSVERLAERGAIPGLEL